MNLKKHLSVLGSVLVLFSCDLIQNTYKMPGNSMAPTINMGDYIVTLPCVGNECAIEHGTIVVFLYPGDPSIKYTKRVIGMSGDRVVYKDKQLSVNSEPTAEEKIGSHEIDGIIYDLYTQKIFNKEFQILKDPERNSRDVEFTIPENMVFVMGDHRDNSNDSRFFGPVPIKDVVATFD